MTHSIIHLRALVEKAADADILREMISFAAGRLMKMEVGGLTGAAHGEKSADRIAQRSGYWTPNIPLRGSFCTPVHSVHPVWRVQRTGGVHASQQLAQQVIGDRRRSCAAMPPPPRAWRAPSRCIVP